MHEHLAAPIAAEEAEPFVGVIPFDLASGHGWTSRGLAVGRFVRERHPRLVGLASARSAPGNARNSGVTPVCCTGATPSAATTLRWCWDGIAWVAGKPSQLDLLGSFRGLLPGLYPGGIADKHWTVTGYEHLHDPVGCASGVGHLTTISGTETALSPGSRGRERDLV